MKTAAKPSRLHRLRRAVKDILPNRFDGRILVFPALILYDEFWLRLFAYEKVFFRYRYVFFFSVAFGLLLYGIANLFRGKHNRRVTSILLGFVTSVYVLECIVFNVFRKYISLPNLLATAGSAGRNYGTQMRAAFWSNFPKLLVFAAPVLIHYFYSRKHEPEGYRKKTVPILFIAAAIVITLLTGTAASRGPMKMVYGAQYDFSRATSSFGLVTSSRLALKYRLFGAPKMSFGSGSASVGSEEEPGVLAPSEIIIEPVKTPAAESSDPAGENSGPSISAESSGNPESSGSSSPESQDSSAAPADPEPEPEKTRTYEVRPQTIDGFDLASFAHTGNGSADALTEYLLSQPIRKTNKYTGLFEGKNLILVCAEAYSGYCLNEELMPTLWRLTHNGIYCSEYYQPEWGGSTTTGEASYLLGIAPRDGEQTMLQAGDNNNYFTLGNQLQRLGYSSCAFHSGAYTYYHRNETHENLGYNQFIANENGLTALCGINYAHDFTVFDKTMDLYLDKQPFSIYYMTISGHAPYIKNSPYVDLYYDQVDQCVGDSYQEKTKYYICYQMELEYALTEMVNRLEEKGIADNTVIALVGDHYPYGLGRGEAWKNGENYINDLIKGDSRVSFLEDKNDLILWSGCLETEKEEMACTIDTPVSSLDIVPTLSNLFGLPYDSRLLPGRDIFSEAEPLVFWNDLSWVTAEGRYDAKHGKYYPNDLNPPPADEPAAGEKAAQTGGAGDGPAAGGGASAAGEQPADGAAESAAGGGAAKGAGNPALGEPSGTDDVGVFSDDPAYAEYRARIDALVQNKLLMSRAIADTDYYGLLFGPDDVTDAGETIFVLPDRG